MKRMKAEDRFRLILDAAIAVAERDGYRSMTREDIASHAGVSPSLVSNYLGTMRQMRRTVMRHAIRFDNAIIIVQGVTAGDKHALRVPREMRDSAFTRVSEGVS